MSARVRRILDPILECYLVGSLDAETRAQVESVLAESAADRNRLAELRTESAAFLMRHPPRSVALWDRRARAVPHEDLGLIGDSVVMQELRGQLQRIATADMEELLPILIQGPTGSGKKRVAQAIHKLGSHSSEPFFTLNCGDIAETLLEDELFGHVGGAFTDATQDKDGYFALVGHGTLFLENVAELSPALQTRLLRVLETRRFRPLGPTVREQLFQGRIVAATHVELRERVRQGRFREDLFHRLNVLFISTPSLSDRREDIPALIQNFAARLRKPLHFTPEALELLCQRPWSGNVRALRDAIYRLAILADSELIGVETVERYLPSEPDELAHDEPALQLRELARKLLALPLKDKIGAITKALVQEALEQVGGDDNEAGKKLGQHRGFIERLRKNWN